MKKLNSLLFLVFTSFIGNAQIINIPDANFKARLLLADVTNEIAKDTNGLSVKIDTDSDGEIGESEVSNIAVLDLAFSNIVSLVFFSISKLYVLAKRAALSKRKGSCENLFSA